MVLGGHSPQLPSRLPSTHTPWSGRASGPQAVAHSLPSLRLAYLRRPGLTWMADAGVPLHVLRKIAGHGSLTTTQRYLHPDKRCIEMAGAALGAHLAVGRSEAPGPKVAPEEVPQRHLRIVR
ncbi:tyrosine-type recombinase/integrase [Streptomyces sp. H39-S7]|uniref:tyrosine-type recombinase/integrase n=1 Tax=Streptomyces sp. H39-S7 TaxID=3004357 RepID=UPI0022AFE819|nr:tyrosine-type recombinase/integrase [Streptomyces sp. H39-S7]MCZ4124692.1 tyrosine-type recombinase/integrase [Streptomyces sp. H39-S7]